MMLNMNAVEAEPVLDALRFYRQRIEHANINGSVCNSQAHTCAGEFTNRCIDALILRIEALPAARGS